MCQLPAPARFCPYKCICEGSCQQSCVGEMSPESTAGRVTCQRRVGLGVGLFLPAWLCCTGTWGWISRMVLLTLFRPPTPKARLPGALWREGPFSHSAGGQVVGLKGDGEQGSTRSSLARSVTSNLRDGAAPGFERLGPTLLAAELTPCSRWSRGGGRGAGGSEPSPPSRSRHMGPR